MAKSRVTTNPMYVGGAGGYSFYVRGGEQVIRQRKNNSNYGAGASRTMAQMIRRIRWGNLVNVFKSQKAWQPKAYDSKTKGQTDYNIFMALNINRATVGLTKEMCESGCAVIEAYQVSRGGLPPIALSASGSGSYYVTDIKTTLTIGSSTTVGQLAADIIANNPQFKEGDNIAFISFNNWLAPRVEWPYAASSYSEITLDSSSSTLLSAVPVVGGRLSKDSSGNLQVSFSSSGSYDTSREVGFVAIHTRKTASILEVSSQEIMMNPNSLVATFSGAAWDETCINTYGLTDDVPLEPSFKGAVIENVAINGSDVPGIYGHMLSYDQPVTLVITGEGMNNGNVWIDHDGVRYTPLTIEDDTWTFILGDNGNNRIYVNGSFYGGVSIGGVIVPEVLPQRMRVALSSKGSIPVIESDLSNSQYTTGNCANYPVVGSEEYPYFIIFFVNLEEDPGVFTAFNATIVAEGVNSNRYTIILQVEDPEKPAYLMLDGFIVFVFNYTSS